MSQITENSRITANDFGIAAYAISELYNFILEGYEKEDYGEMTKEETETMMNNLRLSFTKFENLSRLINEMPTISGEEEEEEEEKVESEREDED